MVELGSSVKVPRNIRQIGAPGGRHKIYVEDYVHTFLHSTIFRKAGSARIAVLIGTSEVSKDIRYTFISGAIDCTQYALQEEGIVFDEACWEYLFKEIKESFDNLEVAGWFLSISDGIETLAAGVESAHRKYFSGREKVLFLLEEVEGEDYLFTYEQGSLQKKEGYYIYYEKNLPMQEYMVSVREKSQKKREPDRAIRGEAGRGDFEIVEGLTTVLEEPSTAETALRGYRSMMLERKDMSRRRRRGFLYTTASAAMIALCVLGITTFNNYEKMREVESVLSSLTQGNGGSPEDVPTGVTIDSIPSDLVQPQIPTEDIPEEGKQEFELPSEEQPSEPPSQPEETPPPPEPPSQQEEVPQQPEPEAAAEAEAVPVIAVVEPAPSPAQTYLDQGFYIVAPGDKLELISLKIYNTTAILDKIIELNHIADKDIILIGQKILLP